MNNTDSFKIGENYKTIEYIGSGDTGIVYKGLNINLNSFVAIKFLKPELTRSNKFITHLDQELQSVFKLNHPNIVNVKELIKDENKYYIIMEYVDGINLYDILKSENKILPFETSINIIKQIAEGLSYAHANGVIHRSLQPENIIISKKDKQIKIINFGISQAIANTWLTMTGTTVSNVEYMSPEQAEGENIDYRTDIYSLGIIAYELFTGQVPFKREKQTILQLAMKHISAIPELPSKINKELPTWIENIIIKCIEKKPKDRFQNAVDIIKAFDNKDNIQKTLDLFISSKSESEKDEEINIDMKELEYFLSNDNNNSDNYEIQNQFEENKTIEIKNNISDTNKDVLVIKEEVVNRSDNISLQKEDKKQHNSIDAKENKDFHENKEQHFQIKLFLSILIVLEIIIIAIILFIHINTIH